MKPSPRFRTRTTANSNEFLTSVQDRHFSVGSVSVTPNARATINPGNMYYAIAHHAMGYWANITDEDRKANAVALLRKGRIVSAHYSDSKKYWIVTEPGWRKTMVLRAREYARLQAEKNR